MGGIFISYRRDDAEGHAGRLFRDLRERFGADAVFMDVAGIEPGVDFRRVIDRQVVACDVLLAVIGRGWVEARTADGRRRLDDPLDFVRLETAAALRRGIPVVPVLVHEATMPRPEDLPEDLRDLAFRNAVTLTHARWDSDVAVLAAALARHLGGRGGSGTATDAADAADGAARPRAVPEPVVPDAERSPAPARDDTRWASQRRRVGTLIAIAFAAVAVVGGGFLFVRQQAQDSAQASAEREHQVAVERERQAMLERERGAALERERQAREEAERLAGERAAAEQALAAQRAAEQQAEALRGERDRLAADAARARQAAAREAAAREAAEREAAAREAAAREAAAREAERRAAATANTVRVLAFGPQPPAVLASGATVSVEFDYSTTAAEEVRVSVQPLVGGKPVEGGAMRDSPALPRGQGSGTALFTVRPVAEGSVLVDGVKVRLYGATSRKTVAETTVRTQYKFHPLTGPAAGATGPAVGSVTGPALMAAKVQVQSRECVRLDGDRWRLTVVGGASGPAGTHLFVAVDGRLAPTATPRSETACGDWMVVRGIGCARTDAGAGSAPSTRWRHVREFVATQLPTYAEAVLFGGADPKTAPRLDQHRVEVVCR